MNELQVFDFPIAEPSQDLLGMDTYAAELVSFLNRAQPPFTVGIYGEWGEGKTSFVQLVQHHLQ
jgi:predicted KAP-like P-loop ATPase